MATVKAIWTVTSVKRIRGRAAAVARGPY